LYLEVGAVLVVLEQQVQEVFLQVLVVLAV